MVVFWFLIFGLVWIIAGHRPARVSWRGLAAGVGISALLWVAVGAMGQAVMVRWLLVPVRLWRYPLFAVAALPWSISLGAAQAGRRPRERLIVYAVHTASVLAALAIAGVSISGLYFVILLLPALPVIFATTSTVGAIVDDPWAFAIGNSLFFAWLLAAIFPLST